MSSGKPAWPGFRANTADQCPDAAKHTPSPGYIDFPNWASEKSKTHKQKRCPTCGYWAIWEPRA